jgi:hypothetical protein
VTEEQWASKTYTEEQRDLNGRCSVVMCVEDDFVSNPRLLEDEIERRGLQAEYVFALAESLFSEQDEWGTAHVMKMMRATPEQRCRAFLAVMEAS